MKSRRFNKTGVDVSEIGIGTWQLGGTEWGDVSDQQALDTLQAAAEAGVTFIDTADIYGDGRSETLIGRFIRERADRERFFLATKLGLRSDPGGPKNFERETIFKHTEDSLRRLGVEALDLTQTHCIPAEQIQSGQVFEYLAELQKQGKIKSFGASVESLHEALLCLEHEGLASLQIIFNIFRQKPIKVIFERAKRQGVAIIARLPLASGVLAGKITRDTTFGENDHRNYNRDGQCFNVGETFAGLPQETAVELAETIRPMVPAGMTMAQFALRWCLDFDAVTTVIPGSKHPQQARANAAASDLSPLGSDLHDRLRILYKDRVKASIRGVY